MLKVTPENRYFQTKDAVMRTVVPFYFQVLFNFVMFEKFEVLDLLVPAADALWSLICCHQVRELYCHNGDDDDGFGDGDNGDDLFVIMMVMVIMMVIFVIMMIMVTILVMVVVIMVVVMILVVVIMMMTIWVIMIMVVVMMILVIMMNLVMMVVVMVTILLIMISVIFTPLYIYYLGGIHSSRPGTPGLTKGSFSSPETRGLL